ncbi:MAG: AMP-binding protein, partial [Myxococcales bacterium]
ASLGEQLLRVPASTKQLVQAQLSTMTGVATITPEMRLAHDLGLDSLSRVDLMTWIEREFGFPQPDADVLETVGDVLLAASGEGVAESEIELKPVPARWFQSTQSGTGRFTIGPGSTISEVFLARACANPNRIVVADQSSGVRSYRDLLTAVFVLREEFRKYEGEYLGIMLPASVPAAVTYLAAMFSGKTPVLLNWTTGPRGVEHCLRQLGIQRIVSARKLFQKLQAEGFGQAEYLLSRVVYLEDVAGTISSSRKLKAAVLARVSPRSLARAACPETAAVLFTSGSENFPKSVPLTHPNLLTNLRDTCSEIELRQGDALLGLLPPFHSFGLTLNVLLPLLAGIPVAYHANPTESAKLAALVEAYQLTLLAGTPTFLAGILRTAKERQLQTLRLAVTGAEQCPDRVYDALAERCPQAVVIEGYGITECSPIISANRPGREQPGTIGELFPSVEGVLVDPDTMQRVAAGERGMLIVRGPSVFSGYLAYDGEQPFVEFEGRTWYRTGDLVKYRSGGVLEFVGRLKRFVKIGGEMISLPAIESVLERAFPSTDDEGPSLAVAATSGRDQSELVLFSTKPIEREEANRKLRDAGLSPLHHVRRVITLDAIPLLGTGKTDYRALAARLEAEHQSPAMEAERGS